MSPRGGYRKPSKPAPTSGPGALAKRTDASRRVPANTARSKQPIRTPTLKGSESLQYGDVARLEQAQRTVPLPGPVAPGQARQALGGVKPGESMLFRPTDRPDESILTDARAPVTETYNTSEAALVLAETIRELGTVSPALLRMYQDLRKEGMRNPPQRIDFESTIPIGEGPVL